MQTVAIAPPSRVEQQFEINPAIIDLLVNAINVEEKLNDIIKRSKRLKSYTAFKSFSRVSTNRVRPYFSLNYYKILRDEMRRESKRWYFE